MTIRVEVKDSATRFVKEFARALPADLVKAGLRAGTVVAGQIAREVRDFSSKSDGPKSGALMRSFQKPTLIKTKPVTVGVFSDLPYAAIHEFGGIITPKQAKYLTVPMTPEARRRRARDWPDLFPLKTRNGTLILATRGRSRGEIKAQYVLKNQVVIPAQRYLTRATEKATPHVFRVFSEALAQAAEGAGKGSGR